MQPLVNCVVHELYDDALEVFFLNLKHLNNFNYFNYKKQAKQIDLILSLDELPEKYSEQNMPLLGVPFSCKESFWNKGNLIHILRTK